MIFGDPQSLLYRVVAVLVAITVHEYAHAAIADRLGDPTPRLRGRLSLNPIVHLDLLGTLLLLIAGFGWARPVEVNPRYFTNGRRDMMLVAVAGPLANVTVVFLVGLLLQTDVLSGAGPLLRLASAVIFINAVLAVFNLIPIPPLDGSRILSGLLPARQALAYDHLAPYGPLLLLLLILLPGDLLGQVLRPAVFWLASRAVGGGL